MKYPHKATIYVYDSTKTPKYTKGDSFPCQAEQSPSKLKGATGAVTAADAMIFCDYAGGVKVKKQDRLYVERGAQTDIYDVKKPEQIGNRHFEIYAALNSVAKVDPITGVMS